MMVTCTANVRSLTICSKEMSSRILTLSILLWTLRKLMWTQKHELNSTPGVTMSIILNGVLVGHTTCTFNIIPHIQYICQGSVLWDPRGITTCLTLLADIFLVLTTPTITHFTVHVCILVLLKPWHRLDTDIKHSEERWKTAFDNFLVYAPQKIHHILSGIQYFHECKSTA